MDNYSFFLKADIDKYINKWIVMADDKIISSGTCAKEVYNEAKIKYPNKRLLLAKIPSGKTMIFYGNNKIREK